MKIIFSMKHHHENRLCTSELTACYSLLQASVFRKGVGWSSDVEVMAFIVTAVIQWKPLHLLHMRCSHRDSWVGATVRRCFIWNIIEVHSQHEPGTSSGEQPCSSSLPCHYLSMQPAYLSIMEIPHAKTSPQTEHVSQMFLPNNSTVLTLAVVVLLLN